jgi:hypothetical protein
MFALEQLGSVVHCLEIKLWLIIDAAEDFEFTIAIYTAIDTIYLIYDVDQQ